jgi:hypothetical protein
MRTHEEGARCNLIQKCVLTRLLVVKFSKFSFLDQGNFMSGLAVKLLTNSFLLLAIVSVASPLNAQQLANTVPSPQGLIPCPPQSPMIAGLTRIVGQAGTLDGCFVSPEKVQIQGSAKAVELPLQTAFAITVSSNSYTTSNVDAMYSKTQSEWSNVAPAWSQSESTYEQNLKDQLQKSMPSGSTPASLAIPKPELVSMQRIDPDVYIVISIRQRVMTMNGNTISPIAANGNATILIQGNLIRLTLERQIRSYADVDAVKSEMLAWVQSVRKSAGK